MTDDTRRGHRDDEDPDHEPTDSVDAGESLSFGSSDTGSLPHWTEPPTGEVPRLQGRTQAAPDDDEELDVWSSFSSESPVWRDDLPEGTDQSGEVPSPNRSGSHEHVTGRTEAVPAREPSRITIGTDPSGMPRRPPVQTGRRRSGPAGPTRQGTAGGRGTTGQLQRGSGRDLPVAIAVGVLIAVAFVIAMLWRPAAVVALVTVALGLAAVEFYDKVTERGYRPAVIPGIATCVAAPLAAYWVGAEALPLVLAFGFMATAGGFIGAHSVESGPLPNVSITTLGVVWIAMLGSFAALILRFSTVPGSPPWGTDTLFLLALGVVANDVGALFIGSAAGRTPLRAWISPHKSVEGLLGGTVLTLVVLLIVGMAELSDTWTTGDLLLMAIVISVLAPMGDLVESMFKRNLDVKDFGSIVRGHGGVLDRFDAFLFVLPAVYYLTLVVKPWEG
jgi:phosphatidate cytidylyltransferase